MPEIDKSKINNIEWLKEHDYVKFVRISDNFYVSEDRRSDHSQILRENNVLERGPSNDPIIDDGVF